MSRLLKAAAMAALVLACTLPLAAQDWAGRGRIQGLVKDEQGKAISGAKVTLRPGTGRVEAANPGPAPVTTDKNGKWSVLGLMDGPWGVLIEAEGFIPSEGRVTVNESGPPQQALPITLKPLAQVQKEAPKEKSKTALANEAIVRGNELLNQQKNAAARAEYEKALELIDPPNKIPILRAIASTYYRESAEAKTKEEKAQKTDQAVAVLKQALEIKPDDADTLQLLVNLLVGAGREAEAQTYLAKMPAGAKVDPDTMLNIGIKFFNAKQLDKALDQFSQVVTQNPTLPDAYYYRGLVYLNLGKTAEAKADFKKLLEIDPNHKYAKEAKEFLSSL